MIEVMQREIPRGFRVRTRVEHGTAYQPESTLFVYPSNPNSKSKRNPHPKSDPNPIYRTQAEKANIYIYITDIYNGLTLLHVEACERESSTAAQNSDTPLP
jgi:hypothetical protein